MAIHILFKLSKCPREWKTFYWDDHCLYKGKKKIYPGEQREIELNEYLTYNLCKRLALSAKLEILRLKTMTFIKNLYDAAIRRQKTDIMQSEKEIAIYNYKGFKFYYDKNGIRADLLRSGNWSYDEEISSAIINELAKVQTPIFLDIGAHAGLMTLNVLAKIPSTQIFAFEPGPFQNSLLEKTIEANNLKDKVILYKQALDRKTGVKSFICQKSPDADWSMSNGLLDTHRGKGKQKRINVEVQTLDNWWKITKHPGVNVVKMDTEGAELWILEGATEFLSACKPLIFMEINPLNLHAYPYGPADILHWLNEHKYELETIEGIKINQDNLKKVLIAGELFVARSRAD